jgi:hypothetical protein
LGGGRFFASGLEHEVGLAIVQTQLQTSDVLVRIHKPLDARMQHGHLLLDAPATFLQGWYVVNQAAGAKNRDEDIFERSVNRDVLAPRGVQGIDDRKRLR